MSNRDFPARRRLNHLLAIASAIRRLALLLAAAILVPMGVLVALGELSGEVVVLHTFGASGTEHRTRLWVVEHEGAFWLRAGGKATGSATSWYARLIAHPEVELTRGEERTAYGAVPVAEARAVINSRMREAYPLADRAVRSIRGALASSNEDTSMPIRLDPSSSPTVDDRSAA